MTQLTERPTAPVAEEAAAPTASKLMEGTVVACPECGQPATVEWAFQLGSTSGAVDHVKLSCVSRHHFLMPAAGIR